MTDTKTLVLRSGGSYSIPDVKYSLLDGEAILTPVQLEAFRAECVKEAQQWHPIETAPNDWGSYLVWHENYGTETLWYQFKDGGNDGRKAGNWYSEDEDEDDYPKNYRVSHWMPLPASPKPNDSTGKE